MKRRYVYVCLCWCFISDIFGQRELFIDYCQHVSSVFVHKWADLADDLREDPSDLLLLRNTITEEVFFECLLELVVLLSLLFHTPISKGIVLIKIPQGVRHFLLLLLILRYFLLVLPELHH